MNFWVFADRNPLVVIIVVLILANIPRHLWKAWMRHRNIKAHGWPTAPIDADGDVVYPDKDDE